MAQEEVKKYLEKNGEATLQEIVTHAKVSFNSAIRALNQMEKFDEIVRKKVNNGTGQKISKYRLSVAELRELEKLRQEHEEAKKQMEEESYSSSDTEDSKPKNN